MNTQMAERKVDQIGLDLKIERLRKRLKQGEVAKRAGLGGDRLSRIENGIIIPTLDEVHRIRKAMDTNNGGNKASENPSK
jgi:transcriptional regulator with XRE-family HTH domain